VQVPHEELLPIGSIRGHLLVNLGSFSWRRCGRGKWLILGIEGVLWSRSSQKQRFVGSMWAVLSTQRRNKSERKKADTYR
jgi:hypothetical protein